MTGLELSRAFFERCGRPMLEEQFPALLPELAVGLFGSGSECFGYDDLLSQDHDFEPGFCLFLPEEAIVNRRQEFLLERAYAKLPKSFEGYSRSPILPVGGARHGVLRTAEFFEKKVGSPDGRLELTQWLAVPEQALAEATNGALFYDGRGEVTQIRERLAYFPEDVRRKRLAGHLLLMAQSGQYNYLRCLGHGETGAALLALGDFVRSALSAAFLLARSYQPFYKWSFRALRGLPDFAALSAPLERLLSAGEIPPAQVSAEIERICAFFAQTLRKQGLSALDGSELERQAYAVNDGIGDAALRNMHILAAV